MSVIAQDVLQPVLLVMFTFGALVAVVAELARAVGRHRHRNGRE